jgi:hypothetical protein
MQAHDKWTYMFAYSTDGVNIQHSLGDGQSTIENYIQGYGGSWWELCGVHHGQGKVTFIFKRPQNWSS